MAEFFISVLLPLPVYEVFEYKLDEGISCTRGSLVCVPFGKKEKIGLVWATHIDPTTQLEKIKSVVRVLDRFCLGDSYCRFLERSAFYNMVPAGLFFKMGLVAGQADSLSCLHYALGPYEGLYRKTVTSEKVLEYLRMVGDSGAQIKDICCATGVSVSVVHRLKKLGVIHEFSVVLKSSFAADMRYHAPQLSVEQQTACEILRKGVQSSGFQVFLMDGVPGAGKTEVYSEIIADVLKNGQQVLLLLPEIALSNQYLMRFNQRFGLMPDVWHSDVSEGTKKDIWNRVASGESLFLIGARSALYLPFARLGLIVVDEEHAHSFKQENYVLYQARDMAVLRGKIYDISVILSSATPSLESLCNVERGKYHQVLLKARYGASSMPTVSMIDLNVCRLEKGKEISVFLKNEAQKVLERGEQVLFFINKRGYASLTLCTRCHYRFVCVHCSVSLVEHRLMHVYLCHYCGYSLPLTDVCLGCHERGFLRNIGAGAEKVYEEACEIFPEYRIRMVTSDTLSTPQKARDFFNAMRDKEIDIIVGTQIVSKGYHFPFLTCVGVVDADAGLLGGDLRTREECFQMLYQVAGRSGREGNRKGFVYLQTYEPNNDVFCALKGHDKKSFYQTEMLLRKKGSWPPYGRLAAVILSGIEEDSLKNFCYVLAAQFPNRDYPEVQMFGPVPAVLAKLQGRYRFRFLIKSKSLLQPCLTQWLRSVTVPSCVSLKVDIDPYTFT